MMQQKSYVCFAGFSFCLARSFAAISLLCLLRNPFLANSSNVDVALIFKIKGAIVGVLAEVSDASA